MIKTIEGGICAAKGFTAAGIYCGIRKNPNKKDLAMIKSSVLASAAAVYTTNLVKWGPYYGNKAASCKRKGTGCDLQQRQCQHLQC